MKKIILLAFTILSFSSAFSQSQRTVLVEEFTQASCPPCETTTPALNAIMATNVDKVVQIRYHTSWPGFDPMHNDNPAEVGERVNYYGVTGVPNLRLDGTDTGSPGTASQAQIDAAYGQASPVDMTISHTLSDDLSTATVTVEITNNGTEAYSLATNRLRVALIEEEISWDTPPGSTSLQVFEAVMKTFVTGTAGMMLPEIAAGETWTNTWEDIAVPARIYDYTKLGVVAFIQDDATTRVAQSAHSEPLELMGYPNVSVINAAQTGGSLCDYEFEGSALITNAGDAQADAYTINFVLNGQIVQSIESTEALGAGESELVEFDQVTLPAGSSSFGYFIDVPQGDLSTTDNASDVIAIGKAADIVDMYDRNFESQMLGDLVENAIINRPNFDFLNFIVVNQEGLGTANPLGGFGESANSFTINYWSWNPAAFDPEGSITFAEQYVVPDNGAEFSFDYAFTTWGGSNDRLIVELSTDCGETFTEVFNQAGSQLATAPELNANNTVFSPNPNQWRKVTADVSDLAGETVLVRFRAISGWGDVMYIDNIALNATTAINELDENESLEVFPNPASDYANVELVANNAQNVQLRVINMLGQTLKTENLGTVNGKMNYALDISDIPNGSYLVFMSVDGKDVVKRLSVAH